MDILNMFDNVPLQTMICTVALKKINIILPITPFSKRKPMLKCLCLGKVGIHICLYGLVGSNQAKSKLLKHLMNKGIGSLEQNQIYKPQYL